MNVHLINNYIIYLYIFSFFIIKEFSKNSYFGYNVKKSFILIYFKVSTVLSYSLFFSYIRLQNYIIFSDTL